MKLKINVTQDCIDKAVIDIANLKERRVKCCPIAQALRKQNVDFLVVGSYHLYRGEGDPIPLPQIAQNFVSEFDKGLSKKPAPIEFEIEVP